MPSHRPWQPSLDDLGTPLHRVSFVIVDLETTGGSPADDRITELGAVKVRGGEVHGEFATLVHPGRSIPVAVSALTGISDHMVACRPPVEAVLPSFLEFVRGSVVVAHNARFDVGFLNASLQRLDYPRLDNRVVCTAALARRLVREDVPNCKLATLAEFFRCRTRPEHRALADARATVEVLHALLERAGSYGVLTLEDLTDFARVRNAPVFSSRRHLTDGLPAAPGIYAFVGGSGEMLYVGKATDLRSRVRSYFGSDPRRTVTAMLRETTAVTHTVCPTPLEAAVREVRLLAHHRPRFNRRSKHPERGVYLKLTRERFPRLSIVRAVRDDAARYLGPLPSRAVAQQVADALSETVPLRRCTDRIAASTRFPACALAEMGRCLAPCDGSVSPLGYAEALAPLTAALDGDPVQVLLGLRARMQRLAADGRYDEAAAARNRLDAVGAALQRQRRLAALTAVPLLVAAGPAARAGRGWDVVAVTAGRLVASAACRAGDLAATAAVLLARTDAGLDAPPDPLALARPGAPDRPGAPPGAAPIRTGSKVEADLGRPATPVGLPLAPEVLLISRWLERDGTVVLFCHGGLRSPVAGGRLLAEVREAVAGAHRRTGRPAAELADKRRRRVGRGGGAAGPRVALG